MCVRDRTVVAHPCIGLLLDHRSAAAHDRTGDSRAVLQVRVGGVDDSVGRLGGDVTLHDLDGLPGGKYAFSQDAVHAAILSLKGLHKNPTEVA